MFHLEAHGEKKGLGAQSKFSRMGTVKKEREGPDYCGRGKYSGNLEKQTALFLTTTIINTI